MRDRTVAGLLVSAYVDEGSNGINMRIRLDDGKEVVCHSSTQEPWLRIPKGRDPRAELQKVCDLLNGISEDGEPIRGFVRKRIEIVGKQA